MSKVQAVHAISPVQNGQVKCYQHTDQVISRQVSHTDKNPGRWGSSSYPETRHSQCPLPAPSIPAKFEMKMGMSASFLVCPDTTLCVENADRKPLEWEDQLDLATPSSSQGASQSTPTTPRKRPASTAEHELTPARKRPNAPSSAPASSPRTPGSQARLDAIRRAQGLSAGDGASGPPSTPSPSSSRRVDGSQASRTLPSWSSPSTTHRPVTPASRTEPTEHHWPSPFHGAYTQSEDTSRTSKGKGKDRDPYGLDTSSSLDSRLDADLDVFCSPTGSDTGSGSSEPRGPTMVAPPSADLEGLSAAEYVMDSASRISAYIGQLERRLGAAEKSNDAKARKIELMHKEIGRTGAGLVLDVYDVLLYFEESFAIFANRRSPLYFRSCIGNAVLFLVEVRYDRYPWPMTPGPSIPIAAIEFEQRQDLSRSVKLVKNEPVDFSRLGDFSDQILASQQAMHSQASTGPWLSQAIPCGLEARKLFTCTLGGSTVQNAAGSWSCSKINPTLEPGQFPGVQLTIAKRIAGNLQSAYLSVRPVASRLTLPRSIIQASRLPARKGKESTHDQAEPSRRFWVHYSWISSSIRLSKSEAHTRSRYRAFGERNGAHRRRFRTARAAEMRVDLQWWGSERENPRFRVARDPSTVGPQEVARNPETRFVTRMHTSQELRTEKIKKEKFRRYATRIFVGTPTSCHGAYFLRCCHRHGLYPAMVTVGDGQSGLYGAVTQHSGTALLAQRARPGSTSHPRQKRAQKQNELGPSVDHQRLSTCRIIVGNKAAALNGKMLPTAKAF
ncbi:hypothetical protein B0H15DRAFT_804625 [Mycena belliarum]|uniref:Uncharacterized protein n=1 Tax=Mycena belliarum TaxID=1033014 RepID=A0AAD6TXV7_9AGAR|nr:hypothetical protein B0H15DRAFT_804625 [Mycena belliae]